jgi:RNA polymerase sigma-70 factor (sigma-E family)
VGKGAGSEDFDAFFKREYRALVGLAFVLSGSRTAAEDIAQDALFAAHRRWSKVADLDQPGAWVRRVVANLSVSWLRRRAREVRAMTRVGHRRESAIEMLEPADETFWAAVRALPKRQAQCIALSYLEDWSVAEIATTLQIAPSTVRVHLHQGRMELARRLDEPLDDES